MGSKRPRDGIMLMPRPSAHDETVPHQFNHTEGECPKCARKNLLMGFCRTRQDELPHVTGCGVEGDHLHVQCGTCGYPWVERCYDQLLMCQEEGWLLVESQLYAVLAATAVAKGGIKIDEAIVTQYRGWTIRFRRDVEAGTIEVTAEETPATGEPAHVDQRPQAQR